MHSLKTANLVSLLLIALALAPLREASALDFGRSLTPKEKQAYSGAVGIYFRGFPCTATYLGNGFFLTAVHNYLGPAIAGSDNPFSVSDTFDRTLLTDIPESEYKLHLPPSHASETFIGPMGRVTIPLPDLMIIQVPKRHLAKLKNLKPTPVETYQPALGERLIMIGGGHTQNKEPNRSQLQIGFLDAVEPARPNTIRSYWIEGTRETARPRPGDSGGPLLRHDAKTGNLVQIGVVSSAFEGKKDGKLATLTTFELFTDPLIQDWIRGVLRNKKK